MQLPHFGRSWHTAPKDVVSRVFRELPVEPQTLERVARALGVDAYTFYMTAEEAALRDDEIDAVAAELASATALRRMAQTYLERGNIDKARETLARATDTCRGYASYPDLVVLGSDAN